MVLYGFAGAATCWLLYFYSPYYVLSSPYIEFLNIINYNSKNDRLLDQFCAFSYKVEKLFSFDYVQMNCRLKISWDNEFSTTSITKMQLDGPSVCTVSTPDANEYLRCPGALFSPCYTASGTRETNGPGLSKASGLLLSSTITSNVLLSTACSVVDNGVFEEEKTLKQRRGPCFMRWLWMGWSEMTEEKY